VTTNRKSDASGRNIKSSRYGAATLENRNIHLRRHRVGFFNCQVDPPSHDNAEDGGPRSKKSRIKDPYKGRQKRGLWAAAKR